MLRIRAAFFLIFVSAISFASAQHSEHSGTPPVESMKSGPPESNIHSGHILEAQRNQRSQQGPAKKAPQSGQFEDCFDQNEPGFSEWGWCHDMLHERGFIAELLLQTKSSCCGGPTSGECRIALVDLVNKVAYVNHRWISFNFQTALAILSELRPGFAIVCSNVVGSQVYCVGLGGAF